MTEEEKDKIAHDMVISLIMFAWTLAHALSGGHKNEELEKMIIEESINELKHLLQKKKEIVKNTILGVEVKKLLIEKNFFLFPGVWKKCLRLKRLNPVTGSWKTLFLLFCPLKKRFVLTDYSVSSDAFVISVNYDKSQFEHKINEFVCNIIMEAQKSDLYSYHWKVNGPLCEEIRDPPLSYFDHSEIITFTVV